MNNFIYIFQKLGEEGRSLQASATLLFFRRVSLTCVSFFINHVCPEFNIMYHEIRFNPPCPIPTLKFKEKPSFCFYLKQLNTNVFCYDRYCILFTDFLYARHRMFPFVFCTGFGHVTQIKLKDNLTR